jgi:hypothetical protein
MVLRAARECMLGLRLLAGLRCWVFWMLETWSVDSTEVLVGSGVLWYASVCLLQSSWLFDEKEKDQLGRHVLCFCRQPKKENLTIHLTLLPLGNKLMRWRPMCFQVTGMVLRLR